MPNVVREPIQVYLTPEERAELDRAAQALGVSRSEVLRRGITAVSTPPRYEGAMRGLVEDAVLSPAAIPPGTPPPARPVARFEELMAELDADRGER